jgi:hypothetical protein
VAAHSCRSDYIVLERHSRLKCQHSHGFDYVALGREAKLRGTAAFERVRSLKLPSANFGRATD